MDVAEQSPSDDMRADRADRIEADAWRTMYSVAPIGVADALGLRARDVALGALFLAPHLPIGMFNRVIGLRGTQDPSDEDVEAVIDEARRAKCSTLWVQANTGSALATLLEARGAALAQRRSWAKMLHAGKPPAIATRFRIAAIEPEQAPELSRVLLAAHGLPPSFAPWMEAMTRHPSCRAYAAFDQDRIVAGGLLHLGEHGAWLGLGGTLPSARSGGAQGALMARRIADARSAGIEDIATETGEPIGEEANPSLSNMRRCGFVQVASRLNYVVI